MQSEERSEPNLTLFSYELCHGDCLLGEVLVEVEVEVEAKVEVEDLLEVLPCTHSVSTCQSLAQ